MNAVESPALFPSSPARHLDRLRAWARFMHVGTLPRTSPRCDGFTLPVLNKGATFWIARPLGRHIMCEAGALWLTFDNEPDDVILESGQQHLCAKRSKLGIHAMTEAKVRVD